MEEGNVEENVSLRPRRSSRPSALKMFGIAELSEAFGISLDSESDSDQEFAPTKEIDSYSSSASTPFSDEQYDENNSDDDDSSGDGSNSNTKTEDALQATIDNSEYHLLDGMTDVKSQATLPKLKNPVCHVCLESSQGNDIVTCDLCGLSVHEGCYGVPDEETTNEEAQSDDSSVSTVPWFCDACKAGVNDPLCELCPNKGGLFKQAINGCWVHVVCCLYINEIEYIEPAILSGVTMDAIPSNKWGAKPCSLCEDEWNSTTGVCISCDAGLCKTYFHVTCAQKAGLLCEADEESASNSDQEVPDVYFAHCSTHCDKQLAKKKRKNYQAIELDKVHKTQSAPDARVIHHLNLAKKNYTELFIRMRKWYKPEEIKQKKQPRWLHHSPSAFHLLTEKANAFGYTVKSLPQSLRSKSGVVSVGLNTEYVNFFNERSGQIVQLEKQIKAIKPEVEKLQHELKQKEEIKFQKEAEFQTLTKQSNELTESTKQLLDKINQIAGREVLPLSRFGIPTNNELISTVSNDNLDAIAVTARCFTCKNSHDNHLMIKCDTCHNNYHIHCLDPPLTKVPKKTAKFGWQCEDCCFDSEDELKPQEVNDGEPQSKFGRRIRRKRNYDWEQLNIN